MGAFIAYLHLAHGIRHFFVLAPNLTIYNKLIEDFTPNTQKYVFQGIADFAVNPPEIITGDNYESGRGVREERRPKERSTSRRQRWRRSHSHQHLQHLEDQHRSARRQKPAIKRLQEYIGESYFDYLAASTTWCC